MVEGEAEFVTGGRIAEEIDRRKLALRSPAGAADLELVVRPIMPVEEAFQAWNDLLRIRNALLEDPACYDEIEGSREMNRTGATRLATAFGLSISMVASEERDFPPSKNGPADQRFLVRVRVSRGARFVDGLGTCRVSEIAESSKSGRPVPYSQREHFAFTRAWTRATKRAIADILGGTEAD